MKAEPEICPFTNGFNQTNVIFHPLVYSQDGLGSDL